MGSLLVHITPLALGVAASPLPVVAVLIILITKRARPASIVLTAGWILGNVVAIGIAVTFADVVPMPKQGTDAASEGIFTLLLGIGLVVMGVLARRGRQRTTSTEPPTWVNSVDNLSPIGAGVVAFLNATTSPKNLALTITAGRTITTSVSATSLIAAASLFYVAVASVSIVTPVVLYFVGGERSVVTLKRWRDRVTENGAAIMEITLLVLGVAMSAKGLYNLFS